MRSAAIEPVSLPDSIGRDELVWNFSYGSNMDRSKRTTRANVVYLETAAAMVPGWRLSFDLPAIPRVEPAMASIEPFAEANSSVAIRGALDANVVVHGLCLRMNRESFEKLYLSEGGQRGRYFIETVQAHLYADPENPVTAYAFRTKQKARLRRSLPPSERYMSVILNGARESELNAEYQDYLASLPTTKVILFVVLALILLILSGG